MFSRQHLLVSKSIELTTVLPMVRDNYQRGMKIAVYHPNTTGDRRGIVTYDQIMRILSGTMNKSISSSCDATGN